MASDAPPSYVETLNEAVRFFQKKMEEDPEAATAALAKQLGGAEADAAFAREMNLLRTNINMLSDLFGKVQTGLASFDAEELADKDGEVTKFEPLWEEIRKKFNNNLSKSRTLAGTLAHRVEMYFDTILPMLERSNVSNEEKLDNLTYFLGETVGADDYNEKLQKDEKAAEEIAKEFETVTTQVNGFRSRFDAYFPRVKDALAAKVTEVSEKIKKLEAELDGFKAKRNISSVMIGAGATGLVGAGIDAVMIVAGTIVPVGIALVIIGAFAALGSGISAAVFQAKAAETQSQLDIARVELQQLVNKQTRANTVVQALVTQIDKDIHDISSKVGALQQIWLYIRDQAQTTRLKLEEATASKVPFLIRKDNVAKSTVAYKQLYNLVKLYSQGFDESKVSKET